MYIEWRIDKVFCGTSTETKQFWYAWPRRGWGDRVGINHGPANSFDW